MRATLAVGLIVMIAVEVASGFTDRSAAIAILFLTTAAYAETHS